MWTVRVSSDSGAQKVALTRSVKSIGERYQQHWGQDQLQEVTQDHIACPQLEFNGLHNPFPEWL